MIHWSCKPPLIEDSEEEELPTISTKRDVGTSSIPRKIVAGLAYLSNSLIMEEGGNEVSVSEKV